jgi:tetratricopeptide (TPR) repeat protein
MVRVLSDLQERPESPTLPVAGAFFKACFFGDLPPDYLEEGKTYYDDVFNLLLVAEANQKQGRLEQAKMIYDHLLSGKIKLSENQWVIAKTGLALTLYKDDKSDEAIQIVTSAIEDTGNKIMKAYGKQVQARIISSLGNIEDALELYNYAVRSFDHQGIPLLCCIAHNNRGVAYYRLGEIEKAMEDWEKAIKYAKEAGSNYSEAAILTNIADIESERGNITKALKQLERSRSIFERFNDLEGVSGVEFNMSLVLLSNKEYEKALEHFKFGARVAFPLPPSVERKEREDHFVRRCHENGFMDVNHSIFSG